MMKSIYVFQNPENKKIKIGIAQDWEKRYRGLSNAIGTNLTTLFVSEETEYARVIEALAHDSLVDIRARGEWFSCAPEKAVSTVKEAFKEALENGGELKEKYRKMQIATAVDRYRTREKLRSGRKQVPLMLTDEDRENMQEIKARVPEVKNQGEAVSMALSEFVKKLGK